MSDIEPTTLEETMAMAAERLYVEAFNEGVVRGLGAACAVLENLKVPYLPVAAVVKILHETGRVAQMEDPNAD